MVLNLQARGEAGYSFVADYRRAADTSAMSWEVIVMFPVRLLQCMTVKSNVLRMHASMAPLKTLGRCGGETDTATALQVGMIVSTILFCGGFIAVKGLRHRRREQAMVAEAMQTGPSAPGRVPSDILRGVTGASTSQLQIADIKAGTV